MLIPRVSRQLNQVKKNTIISLSIDKFPKVKIAGEEVGKKLTSHKNWQNWQLGITLALGMSGATIFSVPRAFAQINPDTTLGSQSSVVNNTGNSAIIRGGATRGINLFHSFSNFNVNPGQTVLFFDSGVTNILGRVTGNNPSNILGTLGVTGGNANLFLLNPNGIIFGPNSKLDVRGSFVATTADAIQFGDSGSFSALAPNVPTATLSVNPSAFLFNQIAAKPITNQSTAGLQVPDGKSLLLLGGNVSLDGGVLRAPGGRIELGGLAASGTVTIEDSNSLKLTFPDAVTRADVTLNNNSVVDVVAGDGGDIAINARNINILGGTNVCAGIGSSDFCKTPGSSVGSANSKAGNIILAGTGDVKISQSRLENRLNEGATGNSGNIFDAVINRNTAFGSIGISGSSVSLTDNAQISTTSFGTGSAGIVYVETKGNFSADNSGVFSNMLAPQQKGDAGGILIEAGSIAVNNSEMRVQSSGIGDAGIVYLKADGGTISLSNSFILSDVLSAGVGNAGGVQLEAGLINLTNGTQISSSTYGQGNAGEVIVKTKGGSLSLTGLQTAIFSTLESGAIGNGGSIQIETGSLTLSDGAQLQTLVRGPSDDGTLAGGKGNAGVVLVIATDSVNLIGRGDVPGVKTAIFSTINEGADGSTGNNQFAGDAFNVLLGKGGNPVGSIYILTGNLSLTNGAVLNSSTYGKGNAGAVVVLANGDITVAGKGSGIFSTAESTATGTAGGILVLGTTLFIKDDAEVSVNNQGSGEAGAIIISVRDLLMLNRGKLTATSISGKGGDINIQAEDLLVLTRDSGISTTAGLAPAGGDGGNVTINGRPYIFAVPASNNNSNITAQAHTGDGGNIFIDASKVYEIARRPEVPPTNDISASSKYGINGLETVNSLSVLPTPETNKLTQTPVDVSRLIASNCTPRNGTTAAEENKFIFTGRGGIPTNPYNVLQNELAIANWVTLDKEGLQVQSLKNPQVKPSKPAPTYVEAQGWRYGPNGEVILTAGSPTVTPQTPTFIPPACRGL